MLYGQELQHLVGLGPERALLLGDAPAPEPCVPEPLARLPAGHHHQVLAATHRGKLMRDLKGAQQPLGEQVMRCKAGDILSRHGDAPRGWFKNASDHVEKRCFSRAIWADQPGDRTLAHAQARAIHRVETAEMPVQVVDPDHRVSVPLSAAPPVTATAFY